MKRLLYILILPFAFGCESRFVPELKEAEEIIVIDAWLTHTVDRQHIYITRSQPYFDNSKPKTIAGADVQVKDLTSGEWIQFQESQEGYYYDPVNGQFGILNHEYELLVTIEEETFTATTALNRVPPVDSVLFHYNESDLLIKEPYYTGEFVASDPAGKGDTYWVKAWKNGEHLAKPSELNMVYDAAFTEGQAVDGQMFIVPIRQDFVSPYDEIPNKTNEFYPPYVVGDSLYVEIHSVSNAAFDFLFGVYFYTNRPGGFAELFSSPLANATTNIKSTTPNSETGVAGFFNVAAISGNGKRLTAEMAERIKNNSN